MSYRKHILIALFLLILPQQRLSAQEVVSTDSPSRRPSTSRPTAPTAEPSKKPVSYKPISVAPMQTLEPSSAPTGSPTFIPTRRPSTLRPSAPSASPSKKPYTFKPRTIQPSSEQPTTTQPSTLEPITLQPIITPPTITDPFLVIDDDAFVPYPTATPFVANSITDTQFSNYMFLGSSVVQYWICFKPGEPVLTNCTYPLSFYFNKSYRLLVNCDSYTDYYCSSFFQSAFPGALNFAEASLTFAKAVNKMNTFPPILRVSNNSVPHNDIMRIIIYIGQNDIFEGTLESEFVPAYKSFLETVHLRFPDALIMILALNPTLWSPSSYTSFLNSLVGRINSQLMQAYTIDKILPYVTFVDQTKLFYESGTLDKSLFYDTVHFNTRGYLRFESYIKYFIEQIWTSQYP